MTKVVTQHGSDNENDQDYKVTQWINVDAMNTVVPELEGNGYDSCKLT